MDVATRPTVDVPASPATAVPSRRRLARRPTPGAAWLLVAPSLVVLVALLGYPLGWMIVLSFQRMSLRQLITGTAPPWVGLDNYTRTLTDPFFWHVVARTVVFTVVAVVLSIGVGLLVALLMRRVSTWVRLAMIVAMLFVWAMPRLVSTQVFKWLVDADFGVVNWLIDRLPGVDFHEHSWFISPVQGFVVITAVVLWGAIPFLAITLHAGMSQVPKELEEAATVDGASSAQVFRHVTLPILRPLIVIVTTLSVIWDMQVFEQIWVMRDTKPEQDYFTLGIYSYVQSFSRSNYSLGSAIAVLTVLLMLGVMAFYIRRMFQMGELD
ncbi:MAG TPA: sugar ABC transporter permease [Micromonosporaceae bacterium]